MTMRNPGRDVAQSSRIPIENRVTKAGRITGKIAVALARLISHQLHLSIVTTQTSRSIFQCFESDSISIIITWHWLNLVARGCKFVLIYYLQAPSERLVCCCPRPPPWIAEDKLGPASLDLLSEKITGTEWMSLRRDTSRLATFACVTFFVK